MKKFLMIIFASITVALLASSFSISEAAMPSGVMGITSTPSEFTPTPLPTEMLTPTPVQPTPPPNTPVPTATQEPQHGGGDTQPTPETLPALGAGVEKPGKPDLSSSVMRIQIPNLGLDSAVEGVPLMDGTWDISNLGQEVGWLETSSQPNLGGNTVLIGHLNLIGGAVGPFADLNQLAPGMEIVVSADGIDYHYMITQMNITGEANISAQSQTDSPRLTLITCYRPSWDVTSQSYRRRLIVVAEPVGPEQ
jgi:LPXTG-site transpeptidase (sortase) family protein